jgi:hypothetical protein
METLMSARHEYPSAKDLTEALDGTWSNTTRKGKAVCPAHSDESPSLAITEGKGGKVLWVCRAGCTQDAVLSALRDKGVWPDAKPSTGKGPAATIVATYDYRDATEVLRFQSVRYQPKEFRQRRPDGKGGWVWKMPTEPAHRFLPYRLPELLEAIENGVTVFIVEGEKDVGNAAKIGLVATCNAGGAGKWKPGHARFLKGADVVIIPDNDDPGRAHADAVADTLDGIAARVRILTLPGLPDKGDLSDWIAAGGTADALWAMVENAPDADTSGKPRKPVKADDDRHKPGCPEIQLATGERARVTDEAMEVLKSRGDIFERGGELVRVAGGSIEPIGEEWLLDAFDRCVNFVSDGGTRDAPAWLGRRIVAKKGERGLAELKAVITAPTMREDGSILCKPGFDKATGLFLNGEGWQPVCASPSKQQMKDAAALLWKPFAEFPFVDDAARGVHLATVLTAVIRQTLPMAPGTSYDAPAASTGKTLLAKCVQLLCGMEPEVTTECREEEELRKRLLSYLRSSKPVLLLDNIRGAFGSSCLEAMLTSTIYSDRLLGSSQMLVLPVALMVLISGNNFRPSGDLWRRLLTCRIDAKTEAPEARSFKLDPVVYCRENRQAMVAAALTLLRGFVAAGSPRDRADRLGSFELWDDRVRQAVIWLGKQGVLPMQVADPKAVVEVAKRNEPERMKLAAVLRAIHAIKLDQRWRTAEVIKLAKEGEREFGSNGAPIQVNTAEHASLCEVLEEVAGERGSINPRRLGRWIERNAGTHCDGMWFDRAGIRDGNTMWRVSGFPDAERDDEETE